MDATVYMHADICQLAVRSSVALAALKEAPSLVTHPSINLQDYNWCIVGCRYGPFYHADSTLVPLYLNLRNSALADA